MIQKIFNSRSARFPTRLGLTRAGYSHSHFTRRNDSALPFARFTLPLGSLWDPTLLSRLQVPLTRQRD